MKDEAAKAGKSGALPAQGVQVGEIPKTVKIDTVALQQRQKARREEAAPHRPWAAVVLVVAGLLLLYFLFG